MDSFATGNRDNGSLVETARDDLMSADLERQPSTREDMEMGLPGHGQETEPALMNGDTVEERPKMSFGLIMMNFTPSYVYFLLDPVSSTIDRLWLTRIFSC